MLHRERWPSQKASAAPGYGAVSIYRGGSFPRLMSGRSMPAIFRKEKLGQHPLLDLYDQPWICHGASGCVT